MTNIQEFELHLLAGQHLKRLLVADQPVSLALLKECLERVGLPISKPFKLGSMRDFLNGWLNLGEHHDQRPYFTLGQDMRAVHAESITSAIHCARILRKKYLATPDAASMSLPESIKLAQLACGVIDMPFHSDRREEMSVPPLTSESLKSEEDLIALLNTIHPSWRDLTGFSRLFTALTGRQLTPVRDSSTQRPGAATNIASELPQDFRGTLSALLKSPQV